MKKFFKLVLVAGAGLLAIGLGSVAANQNVKPVSVSAAAGNYYNNADTSSPDKLLKSLKRGGSVCNFSDLGYSGLWGAYKTTDVRSDGKINDIYSNVTNFRPGTDQDNGSHPSEGYAYNREHTIPKSWWDTATGTTKQGCDLFIVLPTDALVNEKRQSYPYGEVDNSKVEYKSANSYSKLGKGSSASGYTGTVFEPADEWKGDIARIYFYAVATYNTLTWTYNSSQVVFKSLSDKNYGLTEYAKNLYMKWHLQDPVSDWEIKRNDKVYSKQGNRNPFIDHPEWANFIWGTDHVESVSITGNTNIKVNETTKLTAVINPSSATYSNMTWSANNPAVCSVDNQGNVTGVGEGTTSVNVTVDGVTGSVEVTVSGTAPVTPVSGGCFGSIVASSIIVAASSLGGFVLLMHDRKKEN